MRNATGSRRCATTRTCLQWRWSIRRCAPARSTSSARCTPRSRTACRRTARFAVQYLFLWRLSCTVVEYDDAARTWNYECNSLHLIFLLRAGFKPASTFNGWCNVRFVWFDRSKLLKCKPEPNVARLITGSFSFIDICTDILYILKI